MRRLDFIDFAKGYAILTIVMFHYMEMLSLPPLLSKAIMFGGTGVHAFFFLSGFGLSLSAGPVSPLPFYRRRLSRIVVPYFGFVTFLFLLNQLYPLYPGRGWYAWLGHIFLYQMFDPSIIESFGGHFWFMSTIIQFYLVFPALAVLARTTREPKRFFWICLALSTAWWIFLLLTNKTGTRAWNSFFLQYLWEFGLGMICARAWRASGYRFWEKGVLPLALTFGLGALLMGVSVFKLGTVGKVFNDIPAFAAYMALMILVYKGLAPWSRGREFFLFTGRISFTLYIVHIFVAQLYRTALGSMNVSLSLVHIPIMLAVAMLTAAGYQRLCDRLQETRPLRLLASSPQPGRNNAQ